MLKIRIFFGLIHKLDIKKGDILEEIIISVIEKFGYFGIIALIAIENIFPPIPSEVILTFGGFATTITNLTVMGVIVASTIGSIIGAIVLYLIGRVLNEERIDNIVREQSGKNTWNKERRYK